MAQLQNGILGGPGRSALFLTLSVGPGADAAARVRDVCSAVPALVRSVGHRDESAALSCVVAIGADAWERLVPGGTRPAQLHPFRELADGPRTAPSTPGDLLLHIRAERADFCHELARVIRVKLGDAVGVIDETRAFAYLDSRDLIGFVDGTENPGTEERLQFVIVADEDPEHAGGSYVTTQRYVTDFARWDACKTEEQEAAIGRTKADDIELDDAACPPSAHKARTTITRDGAEQKILRQNRAFGTSSESGTYFIAYARDLSVTEEMLVRMYVADADGVYDRLLDFTTPVSGTNFFAPSLDVLEGLADAPADAPAVATATDSTTPAAEVPSTLGIGDLRGGRGLI
ncbi:Dyp-type peroxidase [Candidatus Binatia bacterium]|jgi:putative iron-dependent peroxidase|nr:Dyp-type peroxidase [Candidatus Binatia bacterium]